MLIVEDDGEEGTMDVQAAIVVDEAEFSELIRTSDTVLSFWL